MLSEIKLNNLVSPELEGMRLDQALAQLFPSYSRSQLQQWIRDGAVSINGTQQTKPRLKVHTGEEVEIRAQLVASEQWQAQNIPLDVIYEDEELIVINKPVGLVVHPGAGVQDGTLANALLHYEPLLATVPRAGIIHRLDKDTSGLLLIARTLRAHHFLTKAMKNRQITREYEAVTKGRLEAGGTIRAPVGRHPTKRTQMAVTPSGRDAVTHYRVIEPFSHHTHIRVTLETGRTHQIRVHMAHIRHPLVGDPTYGKHICIPAKLPPELKEALHAFKHQALHAATLKCQHPATNKLMRWDAPLPEDLQKLLTRLREHS